MSSAEETKKETRSYIRRTSGLTTKDYMGYAMVDTAGCFTFALVTTLLQKFYTDVFHLSPLFIMIMFVFARVWDGINDPIMGRCSRRYSVRSGCIWMGRRKS